MTRTNFLSYAHWWQGFNYLTIFILCLDMKVEKPLLCCINLALLHELNQPGSNFTFSLAQAVYAPGSKLDWHIHPAGQYLLITEGTGYYQERKARANCS